MRKFAQLAGAFAVLLSSTISFSDGSSAQPVLPPNTKVGWPSAIAAIKNAPSISIINIGANYHVSTSIIKADKIVFQDGAELIFDKIEAPFIVVLARELIFQPKSYQATIMRNASLVGLDGDSGAPPPPRPAKPPKAANKSGGLPAITGADGTQGGRGHTVNMPPFFLAAAKVTRQPGSAAGIDLRILLDGLDGGVGGTGGNGQDGGDGGDGGNGVTYAFGCAGGPGDGASGGTSGHGGQGGGGGDGGDGADVSFVGPQPVLDELQFARVLARPGLPGRGGQPGKAGAPGAVGQRGTRSGYCQGGHDGLTPGTQPSPSDLGRGPDSQQSGQRGQIHALTYDIDQLFSATP